MLSTAFDLLLVLLGFSLIIIVHELGHFLAARWAGIRVLAFAVGFGPALFSFRKGLGWRTGSSEREFRSLVRSGETPDVGGRISPTEYRLNILPLGGYVKMLGQDDSDPSAVSDAPDGYQRCVPWKRMVVISAGVVMNLLLAAALFCAVFMLGLTTEAPRIGAVDPGAPAAGAVLVNETPRAAADSAAERGLRPGDRIVSVNGSPVESFNDIQTLVVTSRRGSDLEFVVERPGAEGEAPATLTYRIEAHEDPSSRLLQVGLSPMMSRTLQEARNDEQREIFRRLLKIRGAPADIEPGSTLVAVNGRPASTVYALDEAARSSAGSPLKAEFRTPAGATARFDIPVRAGLQTALVDRSNPGASGVLVSVEHLLGAAPVMVVADVTKDAEASGLKAGDVVARLADTDWPTTAAGVSVVRANKDRTISVVVMRRSGDAWERVELPSVKVQKSGQIGINLGDSAEVGNWVGAWPSGEIHVDDRDPAGEQTRAAPLRDLLQPGTRIVSVNGEPTPTLRDVREALRRAAESTNTPPATAVLMVQSPPTAAQRETGATPATETVRLNLTPPRAAALAQLSWSPSLDPNFFQPELVELRESNPLAAIVRGVHETHGVMMMTYTTFLRLFQGSIKVEHLKGPVGIAHIGTQLASRGFVWLMFFLGLISVNLAVVNFLPIPVTDGGHFLFLLYEQIAGRPPPVAVQNAAMMAGMVLLGVVFIFVFVNDIINLTK